MVRLRQLFKGIHHLVRQKPSVILFLLLTSAGLLVSCTAEGVAGFSPAGQWTAIISGDEHLYTMDMNGGNVVQVETAQVLPVGVSFDPSGSRILYATSQGVCLSDPRATNTCTEPVLPIVGDLQVGLLSFLPNGQFIVVFRQGNIWEMRIYNQQGGDPVVVENNIQHFFLPRTAFDVKNGTNGQQWYITPYGPSPLRIAFTRDSQVFRYDFSSSVEGPVPMGSLSAAARDVLNTTSATDISARILSPDGVHAAARTQSGEGDGAVYGLYAFNLNAADAQPGALVTGANFRISFDFSPSGNQIVYESNQGGRTVWIAGAGGENPQQMASGASIPSWH